jgi:hypothetical protein
VTRNLWFVSRKSRRAKEKSLVGQKPASVGMTILIGLSWEGDEKTHAPARVDRSRSCGVRDGGGHTSAARWSLRPRWHISFTPNPR